MNQNEASPSHELFIPLPGSRLGVEHISRFVGNVELEVANGDLEPVAVSRLFDDKSGHGVRRTHPRYWQVAYDTPLARAVERVFQAFERPRLLDVCCGTGTQSLLFATLGARVTALDNNEDQLDVLSRRLALYRTQAGTDLDISIVRGDARDLSLQGPFDVIYSHAGWTAVTGSNELFASSQKLQVPGGIVILKGGNPASLLVRVSGSSIPEPSPAQLRRAAARHGYELLELVGTTAYPKQAWARARAVVEVTDLVLRRISRLWLHTSATFRLEM